MIPQIVDTCVLLWLAADPAHITAAAKHKLKNEQLFVSAISAFEVAVKHKKQKLDLPMDPWKWFQETTSFFKIKEIPISAKIAAMAPTVDVPHADPCDRIIIATAITNNMEIITSDRLIKQCPQINVNW